MNILHVKYAIEVAKLGSLSRAAETLLTAQPNISRSIKELESDLGITIFNRSAKGMELTPEGAEFISYATEMLKQIAGEEATVRNVVGTIYHHDHIATDHPLVEGLSKAGALEFDKYGIVYPEYIFQAVNKPSRTVCAAIRVDGAFTVPGLSVGEYACGTGKYVLNSFRLCQCIGRHPFADKLLFNAIKHYGK